MKCIGGTCGEQPHSNPQREFWIVPHIMHVFRSEEAARAAAVLSHDPPKSGEVIRVREVNADVASVALGDNAHPLMRDGVIHASRCHIFHAGTYEIAPRCDCGAKRAADGDSDGR